MSPPFVLLCVHFEYRMVIAFTFSSIYRSIIVSILNVMQRMWQLWFGTTGLLFFMYDPFGTSLLKQLF